MSGNQIDPSAIIATVLAFLPTLGKAVLALIIGFILARILSRMAKQLAERVGLSMLIERTGFSEGMDRAQITRPPAEILALIVLRIVQFGAVMYTLDLLGITAAMDLLAAVLAFMPRLMAATFALVAGAMLAQFASQLTQAAVASAGVDFHAQLGRLVRALMMVVTVIFAIRQLGFETALLETIFTDSLGWVMAGLALAFGLGGWRVAEDILAGHYARQRFEPGDRLLVDGQEGTLEGIGALNALLTTADARLILPNRMLTGGAVRVLDEAS
jgi:small-conductance mechanosensitive channel